MEERYKKISDIEGVNLDKNRIKMRSCLKMKITDGNGLTN